MLPCKPEPFSFSRGSIALSFYASSDSPTKSSNTLSLNPLERFFFLFCLVGGFGRDKIVLVILHFVSFLKIFRFPTYLCVETPGLFPELLAIFLRNIGGFQERRKSFPGAPVPRLALSVSGPVKGLGGLLPLSQVLFEDL